MFTKDEGENIESISHGCLPKENRGGIIYQTFIWINRSGVSWTLNRTRLASCEYFNLISKNPITPKLTLIMSQKFIASSFSFQSARMHIASSSNNTIRAALRSIGSPSVIRLFKLLIVYFHAVASVSAFSLLVCCSNNSERETMSCGTTSELLIAL